jgi:hypothetical protein
MPGMTKFCPVCFTHPCEPGTGHCAECAFAFRVSRGEGQLVDAELSRRALQEGPTQQT